MAFPPRVDPAPLDLMAVFSTVEPPSGRRRIAAGGLAVELVGGATARVDWHGKEVLRGLSYPVRNRDWGTWPDRTIDDMCVDEAGTVRYERRFVTADDAIEGVFSCVLNPCGHLHARVAFTALTDILVNRAGFVLLHPVKDEAGTPIRVVHSDGTVAEASFPCRISPSQPVTDIRAMAYDVAAASVRIQFGGDVFEMEDQRNWSDASFKTYCRPLALPFPYPVAAGESWTQTVDVVLGGAARPVGARSTGHDLLLERRDGVILPRSVLAHEPGWPLHPTPAMDDVGLLLRVDLRQLDGPDRLDTLLDAVGAPMSQIEVEAILPDDPEAAGAALDALSATLGGHESRPASLTVLPGAWLVSHQPDGPWPSGVTPKQVAALARARFPDLAVGGGVLTNFTELNRLPDRDFDAAFVTYGTTAIVHDADDAAVMQTLEALPQIHASAAALYPGRPIRLGLSAIGMRSNPYGSCCAPNPANARLAMASVDPRQRGLFAAAFMVGLVAATDAARIERIALGSLGGAFALVGADNMARPAWHVFRAACGMAGAPRLRLVLPPGGAGFSVWQDGRARLVLANTTERTLDIALPMAADWLMLDAAAAAAATNPSWPDQASRERGRNLRLGPYAVAFVDIPEHAA